MTASDRFDQHVAELFDDVVVPAYPDYFDDVLASATGRRQRPAWTFPERWLLMGVLTRRGSFAPSIPWRPIVLVALLVALLAAIVAVTGSRRPLPAPFGPAANGSVAVARDGDIYGRGSAAGADTLLVGGPETDVLPMFALDGSRLAFLRLDEANDTATVFVAGPDGADPRPILGPNAVHAMAWSPSNTSIAVISGDPARSLAVVPVAGGAPVAIPTGDIAPLANVEWRPPDGRELVFEGTENGVYRIYAVGADGTNLRPLTGHAPSEVSFGGPYSISPDGRLLAFTEVDAKVQLRVLDLETANGMTTGEVFGPALPPPAEDPGGLWHSGGPQFSPDGSRLAFNRYWNEHDGEINHQAWIAGATGDGSDAIPIAPLLRSPSGNNPFWVAFAPDGQSLLVKLDEDDGGWIAYPDGREAEPLDMGILTDAPAWQRTLR